MIDPEFVKANRDILEYEFIKELDKIQSELITISARVQNIMQFMKIIRGERDEKKVGD